jgi:DNA-binding NarL/FixJ family response regulator
MTVMIVDDNTSMRTMIRRYLSGILPSMKFVECNDGEEALAAYEHNNPDWTLMDIEMECMDGIAATRAIRSAYPDAKIVILTQYNDVDLRFETERAGATGYCLKDNLTDIEKFLFQPHP